MKKVISIFLILALIITLTNFVKAVTYVNGTINFTVSKESHIRVGDEITVTLTSSSLIQAADMIVNYDDTALLFKNSSIQETHRTVENGKINICTVYGGSVNSGFDSFTFTFQVLKAGTTKIFTEIEELAINSKTLLNVEDTSIDIFVDYISNSNWKDLDGESTSMITGIVDNTSISKILESNNYASGCTIKIVDAEGNEITNGNVSTGNVIQIYEGDNLIEQHSIVIYGDVNCNGKISSIDALYLVQNKLNNVSFNNEVIDEASRVTLDTRTNKSSPTAADSLAIIKHKLFIEEIQQ